MNRLNELLEKCFISYEELEEIEVDEKVVEVEYCGCSGIYQGYKWHNVIQDNGREDSIYVK